MNEIQKIKEKFVELLYDDYYENSDANETFELIPGDIPNTYYYADIDYADQTLSNWQAAKHYTRLQTELINCGRKRLEEDAKWRNKMIGALEYWVRHDFLNPNWWHNQIGMPKAISNISLLLDDFLPNPLKEQLERLIIRGSFKLTYILGKDTVDDLENSGSHGPADRWVGANLIWGATTTIKHALLTEDAALLKVAVKRLEQEICYAEEGIQADGAFCQHGPRWYSGGYGRYFVFELAPIIYILQGTAFELSESKLDMILSHILDGQRAMQKSGYFDFNSNGREYSRPGFISTGILNPALKLLTEADNIARQTELKEFYNEISGGADNFEITKFYDSICQLCHKKSGVYIGVRGRRNGIHGTEECNNEGVLGYNMSYGTVTCVMETGKEYFDIAPFWDYSKIPGTTARAETDEQLLEHKDWSKLLETACDASGKVSGNSGILWEKAYHDGIGVVASFFVFDGALVALGTDIKDENQNLTNIYTTVEQCRAFDPVIEKNYVTNGNIKYKNLDFETEFCAKAERKTGSWSRNNYAESNECLEDTLITITIPIAKHGAYSYLIFKGDEPQVKVLKNDKDCQAIQVGPDKIMAVFHNDTSFEANSKNISGKKGEIFFSEDSII